jgi:predicted transcriptional regulator
MKAVLMSIKKQWIEKILDGEKTIEVRKTKPNLEVPFKVYIYCTKDNQNYDLYINEKSAREVYGNFSRLRAGQDEVVETRRGFDTFIAHGKVIGEFICDRIEDFYCASVPYKKENNLGYGRFVDNGVYKVDGWHEGVVFERNDRYIDTMLNNNDLKEMCLSAQEVFDYIGIGKHLYACHISYLKIYDKPKELSKFKSWRDCETPHKEFMNCKFTYRHPSHCECCQWIKRPPQSYMFVEEK